MKTNELTISKVDMRDAFFYKLYQLAKQDRQVMLLVDDFGAPSLDQFRRDLPHQYINVGIAEQNMVSVAAGLALEGKKVYVYAIAPFVTLRCFEQIKIDLCLMNLDVTAVGVGAGFAYDSSGPTHHAIDDLAVMMALPNIQIYSPSDSVAAEALASLSYTRSGPKYIRFDRGKTSVFYPTNQDFTDGLAELKKGKDILFIATGAMVNQALCLEKKLKETGISAGVIDLYRLKPLNKKLLKNLIGGIKRVFTLEEHVIDGGLGSLVSSFLADYGVITQLERIGIESSKAFCYGKREALNRFCKIDIDSILRRVLS